MVQRFWDRAHGRHLAITATATGGGSVAFLAAAFHLIVLRPMPEWEAMTGLAIAVLVLATLVLLVVAPPFLRLRGHVASLEEIMATSSIAERRRRRAEGDEAAAALGAGWAERWKRFLEDGRR
ncbi:MAG: hypothetical protein CMA08_00535 [Euryarchaeota archaeon]|nr:hypothetical protein [Euryarchaeota archaeon]OUX23225.1 MAG: hypothetical protein CBE12_00545 [Euryarchaeota archaeon TMED252]HIH53732.1 hypothetical protein [Candidatus Poseidoniaceae archaeon]